MGLYQRFLPYGVAIASVAMALVLRTWLQPMLVGSLGTFFYIAILVSSWYGGLGPGMVAVVLSTLAINYFFMAPFYEFRLEHLADWFQLGTFLFVALTINSLTSRLSASRRKIEKLNQKIVAENSDRLRIALNAAQMGLWDWDRVTNEINWSLEHEQLFGLPLGSFDGRYETFEACLHPDDRESLNQVVAQSLSNHVPYQHEFRVIWRDGSIHWIEGRGQAFYDEAGKAVRMSGTVMAIDDRKRLERALQQSEQQFRAIFEAEPECVKVITVEGILRNMNPAGLAMLEADSLESVLGQCVCPLISPAHQQAFLDFTQQVALGKTALLEFEMVGLKGTRRWLESRAVPLQTADQSEVLILCVTRDITERKQAEATLREQEAILRLFIQFAPASIAMFDRQMHYIMASQRWIDEYHLDSLESVIGRSHYDIFPEIPERWRQIHQRCLAGAIEKCDDDLLMRADGTSQWISWEIRPWHTVGSEIGGIIIFSTDVTDRKQAENSLQRSEQRYRALVHASSQIVWGTDENGSAIDNSSSGWEELTGQPLAAFRDWGWIEMVHPDDRDRTAKRWQECYTSGSLYEIEYRLQTKNGDYADFAVRGVPILDANGNVNEWVGTCTDITKSKQAETDLRESELRFRTLADNIAQLAWIADETGWIFWYNQRWFDYTGTTLEEMQGWGWRQVHHPDHVDRVEERLRHCFQTGETWEDTFPLRAQDGQYCWFLSRAVPIHDEQGRVLRWFGTNTDITERKRVEDERQQAEETLRQSEMRLRLAQRASNCGVWDWDLQTTRLFWSPEFYQLYGLNPTVEPKYENWLDCIHPDDRVQLYQVVRQALTGTNTELNVQFRVMRSGEVRWFAGIGQVFRDAAGKARRMAGITIDITRQKQTEIALQQLNSELEQRVAERTKELITVNDRLTQSEEKFRQLAENIQDVFWITDLANQQVLYVSPAYETLWGKSRELLYQNFGEWLDSIYPDDRSCVEQTVREKTGQGYYDHEYRIIRADGSIRWIRDRAFPIKDEAGKIIRLAGIAEDITERQGVEEIKNEFIGIVSHELRTPLTAIQMSLGLLKSGVYANKPERAQRMIEIAFLDTNRLVNLVNDILDLERLESGRAILEKEACRADELMRQAVDSVQSIAVQHHITLILTPTDAVVWAAADTIIQTLTNLLSNAIKFSLDHSVINLRAEHRIDKVLFQVSDRGRGIPSDKLETVFGRFQQVDASDSREKGGTGLGLPICRSIIERHGGKIWVESILGQGSTFFFTLPVPAESDR